jgi:hypothetical protein
MVFAKSITKGSFIAKGNHYTLEERTRTLLGVHADRVLAAYGGIMDGTLHTDFSVETELDGTYDQLGDMIIHWREDGWIDVLIYENFAAAENTMEQLSDLHYGSV